MEKDFDKWNDEKKLLHLSGDSPFYSKREIWWCALGVNIGFEQDGTGVNFDRPVLVIKGFNKNTFLGLALTGRKKAGEYYFYLGKVDNVDSTANLSQIKIIDTKRLIRKIETLDEMTFIRLQDSLKKVIFE
ncbi:MAG: type II toxin-antitoxin system PemK/MazF family toxin [Candidatus Paceibacterota bacterium]